MGKINIGIFYGKLYNSRNRTFSLENGENFIEGTGHSVSIGNHAYRPVSSMMGFFAINEKSTIYQMGKKINSKCYGKILL